MSFTQKEIFSQYQALEKTYDYMLKQRERIVDFYLHTRIRSITFIGCGSSYSIAKSAATVTRLSLGIPAYAFSAGDLLINFPRYKPILEDTLLVTLSRSGSTSEVVLFTEKAKREFKIETVSICAYENSTLSKIAAINLEIPWAFDQSVCQTRCVTNLYTASLIFISIVADDCLLLEAVRNCIANGEAYIEEHADQLKRLGTYPWEKVIILADGELEGIAEEGALAFAEIARIPSGYHHVLDVRHGPFILIDEKTLVIVALSPCETQHQKKLLEDIKARGAVLVVYSDADIDASVADYHVVVPKQKAYAANGLPFIFLPQALSLFKAIELGIDPDRPQGLEPWIQL